MKRPQADMKDVAKVQKELTDKIKSRLDKHGYGVFASGHECIGIMTEEWQELVDELHDNNPTGVESELYDVAVAAIWGIVSLNKAKNGK